MSHMRHGTVVERTEDTFVVKTDEHGMMTVPASPSVKVGDRVTLHYMRESSWHWRVLDVETRPNPGWSSYTDNE